MLKAFRKPLPPKLSLRLCLFAVLISIRISNTYAEELPLRYDVPIEQFQNRQEDVKPYNYDAPPEGMFRSIDVTEGFEEELGFRRQHLIVPVNPTSEIHSGSKPVFIVFHLHQHFQSFQVLGVCYPEEVSELDPHVAIARDAMYLATEDESGYLKFFPPSGGWKPGKYKVAIHVGEEINDLSLMGTMRFTVTSQDSAAVAPSVPVSPSVSDSQKP
jgi:hypothetical protein